MSTPSDLTQSGETLILAMINAANPSMVNGPATPTSVTLGTPNVTTTGGNTSLVVSGVDGQGYLDFQTFTYNRLDIQADVMALKAPSGVSFLDNTTTAAATVADLLPVINAAYGLNIQPADVSNAATAMPATYPKTVVLTMATGCLTYIGSLSVTVNDPLPALATVVTSQAMNGLNLPQLQ